MTLLRHLLFSIQKWLFVVYFSANEAAFSFSFYPTLDNRSKPTFYQAKTYYNEYACPFTIE